METASAMKKEDIPTEVLFDLKRRGSIGNEKKKLEDFPIVKCAPGEKILIVQRRHKISLIGSVILETLISILVLFMLFSPIIFRNIITINFYNLTIALYIALTTISIFFLIEMYHFLLWYYELYTVTNKAIIHRHFFRIIGEYSETVYGDKMHVQDVARVATNAFYDYLKIQDVYVYFHKLERERPFIFKTPENAQEIDDLIQNLVTQPNGALKTMYK